MQDRKRVVITGMGALTPLGNSVEEFWTGLISGKSGIGPITLCDSSNYPCHIAGEVRGFDPNEYINPKEARRMARFSHLGIAAAHMAMQNAGLDTKDIDDERLGVVIGNGIGSLTITQEACEDMLYKGSMKINPFFIPMILPNMASANIARVFDAKGHNNTINTACAASTQAIGEAAEAIRRGAADIIISGGSEASVSELGLSGFCILKALSTRNEEPNRASRPFDKDRDGFVPSEGAGILILESLEHALARGANILAEIIGYAASSDAFHPVQPDENGAGASRAMSWTLRNAGVNPNEVDYINAHGTSTPLNDEIETMAIKKVFGEHAYKIPISSTKSMIGHALGASGAMEAIACVKTIQENIIHPTANLENQDPKCDLDYVPLLPRQRDVKMVMSNSFGFGGQNACILLREYA